MGVYTKRRQKKIEFNRRGTGKRENKCPSQLPHHSFSLLSHFLPWPPCPAPLCYYCLNTAHKWRGEKQEEERGGSDGVYTHTHTWLQQTDKGLSRYGLYSFLQWTDREKESVHTARCMKAALTLIYISRNTAARGGGSAGLWDALNVRYQQR